MKPTVFIYTSPYCPERETLTWWKRWLNKVGYKFEARIMIFALPNGGLVTAPANVFTLRSKLEAMGHPVHVVSRNKGPKQ